jgi:flagellar FliJ protein
MKFVYSFQKVVDLKTNEKKQAESVLSQALGDMASAEQELSELMLLKYRVQQQLVDEAVQKRSMHELIAVQRYVDYVTDCIQAAKRKLVLAEQTVTQCRDQVTDRAVDEKVWLKAREKAYLTHHSSVLKHAQAEQDEMATLRSRLAR